MVSFVYIMLYVWIPRGKLYYLLYGMGCYSNDIVHISNRIAKLKTRNYYLLASLIIDDQLTMIFIILKHVWTVIQILVKQTNNTNLHFGSTIDISLNRIKFNLFKGLCIRLMDEFNNVRTILVIVNCFKSISKININMLLIDVVQLVLT